MKRFVCVLSLLVGLFAFNNAYAQTAKQVLDKCAAAISARGGVQADFTMNSAQYGEASGQIMVKGKMFMASTSIASMWFDGTTLWTYMTRNNEVNVTTPSEAQLQVLNPYNFINMYKKDFAYTMTQTAEGYNVHLTSTDATRKVKEMFITVDKTNYHPTEVKLLQNQKWTTFTIKNLKTVKLADDKFRFNSKDFPSAEVIDLR